MKENIEVVKKYKQRREHLRKKNNLYIKKIPNTFFKAIFIAIGLIFLLDGKVNAYVGNSLNLIIIIVSVFGFTFVSYLIRYYIKTKKNTIEIKTLGAKIQKLMSL
jgi:hypothetical protein